MYGMHDCQFSNFPLVYEKQQLTVVKFCNCYGPSDWLHKLFEINRSTEVNFWRLIRFLLISSSHNIITLFFVYNKNTVLKTGFVTLLFLHSSLTEAGTSYWANLQ